MGIVVGWINAPLITGLMMTGMPDTVENRVTHIDVGGRHIDLGPQRVLTFSQLPARIFANKARLSATGRSRSGLLRPASVNVPRYSRACFGAKATDIGMTRRNELIRELKQSVEVARRVTDFPIPFEPEPPDIIFYRIHIF